jgi:membrane protease YdiL (CAAX protease family)
MNVPEIIRKFASVITLTDIICVAGLLLFACWLLRTSLGRNALADSVPRRNNMPPYLPFIPLFIWFGAVSLAVGITREFSPDLPAWEASLFDHVLLCTGGTGVIAVVNLLSVWPLVMAAIIITTHFGRLTSGQDFQIQQHEELTTITAHSQLPLRVLIIITAIVIAPVVEEMLFRGLFQSMIRGLIGRAWVAIILTSVLFALLHPWTHWPALFVLAMCLGYSYEKSGSLLRPIFIHAFFNASSVISVLYGV